MVYNTGWQIDKHESLTCCMRCHVWYKIMECTPWFDLISKSTCHICRLSFTATYCLIFDPKDNYAKFDSVPLLHPPLLHYRQSLQYIFSILGLLGHPVRMFPSQWFGWNALGEGRKKKQIRKNIHFSIWRNVNISAQVRGLVETLQIVWADVFVTATRSHHRPRSVTPPSLPDFLSPIRTIGLLYKGILWNSRMQPLSFFTYFHSITLLIIIYYLIVLLLLS